MSGSSSFPGKTHRILLADDDSIYLEIATTCLQSHGDHVISVDNGDDAWRRLKGESYDLAVIDIHMPKLDGFELIRSLRQTPRTVDLPILVTTSRRDKNAIEEAFSAGATSFVTKPINVSLFAYQVQLLLRNGRIESDLKQARLEADAARETIRGLLHVFSSQMQAPLDKLLTLVKTQGEPKGLQEVEATRAALTGLLSDVASYALATEYPSALDLRPCTAETVLREIDERHRRQADRAKINLVVRRSESGAEFLCNGSLLSKALDKLVLNAIARSPVGGTIEAAANAGPDDMVAISIRDNGRGLSARMLRAALALPNAGIGRDHPDGFGLPLVDAIARAHGGRFTCTTAPGEGMLSTLRLPLRAGAGRAIGAV